MNPEINFKTSKEKEALFDAIKAAFPDGTFDMLDGLTVTYPDFWFNLRASNTEPLMRLNAEAESNEILEQLIQQITKIIE